MTRHFHFRSAIVLVLLVALVLPALGLPGVRADDEASVPIFRGNPARTGEMPDPGPP